MQDHPLIFSLVLALTLAAVFGSIARALRVPPLVGYLLAGVAVSPHTPGPMVDPAQTGALAEIGVALLLFGVGLHFEVRDLWAVRRVAIPGALGQVTLGMALGAFTGWVALGLKGPQAWVFGLALAIASTAVATRLLNERKQMNGLVGGIALGWLVVQDLVVVLGLVLLPAMQGASANQLALAVGKALLSLLAFIAVMLLFGRRALPWLLKRAARSGSVELFTLAVVAVALGVAWGSTTLFGVSLALGAFFAGVVLGETDMSHQAAARTLPLEHIFAVIFFVSVGMQFRPGTILAAPFASVAVVLATLLATGGATFLMLILLRQEPREAAQVAVALAQIGEFSFVLMELAVDRHLLPEVVRGPVLLAALVLAVANPAIALGGTRLADWVRKPGRLPRWLEVRPATIAPPEGLEGLAGHAIIVGHGRVGRVVVDAMRQHGFPHVVVDADHRRVDRLRRAGTPAIWGDATDAEVIAAARPQAARLLVLALPIDFESERVLAVARQLAPGLDVAVRAHTDAQLAFMAAQPGVGLVVMGEREVGLSTVDYALRRFGLDAAAAQATVDALRAAMPGSAVTGWTLDPEPPRSA